MKIVVRGPNWVGDAVLATAVIRYLAALLPTAEIHLWTRSPLLPLYSGLPVRGHLLSERKGLAELITTSLAVKEVRGDAALLLAPSLRAGLEVALAGIDFRVGYPDDHRGWLLNPAVHRTGQKPAHSRAPFTRHQLAEWQHLVDALANRMGARVCGPLVGRDSNAFGEKIRTSEGAPAETYQPRILPDERAEADAQKVLARIHPRADRPLVGVQAFSCGGPTRNWPAQRYAAVVDGLSGLVDPDFVFFGGPGEGARVKALAACCHGRISILAGDASLPLLTFAALAPHLSTLVTNDTGPMHLAAACGTRVVAIFGSTHPELTGPMGTGHACLHRADLPCAGCYRKKCSRELECLTGISVEEVATAAQNVIRKAWPPDSSGN